MAEAEEPPLPEGWSVISYVRCRPNEYYYHNRLTNKEVRALERPTEPPPEGVELLRNETSAIASLSAALGVQVELVAALTVEVVVLPRPLAAVACR